MGIQLMLASDDEPGVALSLNFSLASDIVELVVLTTDEIFLQTLRDAVGDSRRLWHVPSPDKVSDLLIAGQVGILVLDGRALQESASVFVSQIKRQFPELVIVAAGMRDDETELGPLISAGIVYRFIHKPMSPGRAKLFADAAVRKHEEQRRHAAMSLPKAGPSSRSPLWLAGTIGALAVGGGLWAWQHAASLRPAERSALGAGVPSQALNGLAADGTGLAQAHDRLLARAEHALLEERFDEAAAAIETARKAGVDGGRIAFLSGRLVESRARLRTLSSPLKKGDAGLPDPSGSKAERLARALDLAAERSQEDRLVEPDNDSAKFYVEQALQIDPESSAAEAAEQSLALALLAEAHVAIDQRNFGRAARMLEAADGVASPTNVDHLSQLLRTARKQAESDAMNPTSIPHAPDGNAGSPAR